MRAGQCNKIKKIMKIKKKKRNIFIWEIRVYDKGMFYINLRKNRKTGNHFKKLELT